MNDNGWNALAEMVKAFIRAGCPGYGLAALLGSLTLCVGGAVIAAILSK